MNRLAMPGEVTGAFTSGLVPRVPPPRVEFPAGETPFEQCAGAWRMGWSCGGRAQWKIGAGIP